MDLLRWRDKPPSVQRLMILQLLRHLRAQPLFHVPSELPLIPFTWDPSTFSAFFLVDGPAVIFIDCHPLCQEDGAGHSVRPGCQVCPVITLNLCCFRLFILLMHRPGVGSRVGRNAMHPTPCNGTVHLQGNAAFGIVTVPAWFFSLCLLPS